jgi:hypothetical protein
MISLLLDLVSGECYDCTPGFYCGLPGKTEPTAPCLPRYYCAGRANNSAPTDGVTGDVCPLGSYCPEGSAVGTPCPATRYGNTTGLAQATECPMCDPGWYCPSPGLVEPFKLCEPGHYCELGANTSNPTNETYGYLCPVGHYCPKGTPTPQPCDKGYYQPSLGKRMNKDCVQCTPGCYCLETGQSAVKGKCQAGYYCTRGANVSNPTGEYLCSSSRLILVRI